MVSKKLLLLFGSILLALVLLVLPMISACSPTEDSQETGEVVKEEKSEGEVIGKEHYVVRFQSTYGPTQSTAVAIKNLCERWEEVTDGRTSRVPSTAA